MKQLKEIILGIFVMLIFGSLVVFIYRNESNRTNRELAKRISELSPRGGPPETIDGLRQAIALYEDQIERNVREGAQTGVYWKILAIRLADKKLHNDALEALERAVYYNSEDTILYYLIGVSAANIAKSKVGFSNNAEMERDHYYNLSENAYLRALELDITYAKAMYGLAILYVFELDRPRDAIVHLERYLQMQTSDISAMFVLARAYFMIEDFSKAMELYDRIVSRTKDSKVREEALNNKDVIQGMLYG
ncbi:MAG: tetratricopeptide repeat protein [Treponema sp.]|jgi:tetratricopeptide (TPR) repeat protein|nr:tetratricopeptide repeat protein [Treponema sp.]